MIQWLSLIAIILLSLIATGHDELLRDFTAARNERQLAKINAQTKQFITHHNRTPHSAQELRSFIRSRGHKTLSLFDSRGNPVQYMRFSQFNYLLRALGTNEIEDNVSRSDDSVVAKIPIPAPVRVRYDSNKTSFYPHLNLLGSRYGTLVGWIAIDREGKQKKLVIRSQDNPKLIMTAPHKLVDEFLWIKGASAVVYTTSDQEDAGIYLWHYGNGKITSLSSTGFVSQTDSNGEDSRRYIALKGFDSKTRRLSYYQLDSRNAELDPARFFAKSHEKVVQFSKDFNSHSPVVQLAAYRPKLTHPAPMPLNGGIDILAKNTRQDAAAWQQVQVSGTASDILESWQRYSLGHTASPLYPYSLWSLSTIYGQAYQIYAAKDHPGAKQLQRFGMQIADALAKMPIAPAYLRAFAAFNFRQIGEGTSPSLPLAHVSSEINPEN